MRAGTAARAASAAALLLGIAAGPAAYAAESGRTDFGAWRLACSTKEAASCFVWQSIAADPTRRQTVLGVSVRIPPASSVPEMQFRMSAQADRAAGIGVKIDRRPDYRLAIAACDERVCEATGRIEGPVRDQLVSGKYAQVAFFVQRDQHTAVLNLEGFAAALKELERRRSGGRSG